MARRPTAARKAGQLLFYLVLAVVLGFYLFPLVWMAMSSFKTQAANIAVPPVIFFEPVLSNYRRVFSDNPFLHFTLNSMIVAIGATGMALLLGLPASYAIARYGRQRLGLAILVARITPGISYLVPWFIFFSRAHLVGTYWALILTHLTVTLPLVVWIMIGFFEDVPNDYYEVAVIDGANEATQFARIALPLVRSGILSSGILAFIMSWNVFMYSVVMADSDTQTLPVAAFNFLSYGGIDWGGLTAAATLITLPVMLLVLFVQRYIVSGLTLGGLKG